MKNLLTSLIAALSISLTAQATSCGCFNGIGSTKGDKPNLTIALTDEVTFVVCGFELEKYNENEILISEFNIFNCQSGEALVEYDAVQTCKVLKNETGLQISELKLLPAGENWNWKQVKIGFQQVLVKEKKIVVQEQKPAFEKVVFNNTLVDSFISELHERKGTGKLENPEEILGRLEFLALNGIQEAKDILYDFENYFAFETDGAIAEQWGAAVATVKWANG
tara:strand:- start:192 stop:860 length:669 start_codon:yes stop_codon:yes gene_type:complete